METSIPSEFAAFVHDVATRAFDSLEPRIKELETPLRAVVRSWSKLSSAEKDRFVDELIDAVQNRTEPPAEKPKPRKKALASRKAAAKKR
jgi:hypothetical protein